MAKPAKTESVTRTLLQLESLLESTSVEQRIQQHQRGLDGIIHPLKKRLAQALKPGKPPAQFTLERLKQLVDGLVQDEKSRGGFEISRFMLHPEVTQTKPGVFVIQGAALEEGGDDPLYLRSRITLTANPAAGHVEDAFGYTTKVERVDPASGSAPDQGPRTPRDYAGPWRAR